MNQFVARITNRRGTRARQARKLLVLTMMAWLVCWPLPDRTQAAGGDIDPTFGSGGKVITDFFGLEDEGAALVIQPDGKIVAGGTAFTVTFPPETMFALARYNPDGSPDPTFGSGGRVTTAFVDPISGNSGRVQALALQPDGKIVAAGTAFPSGGFPGTHIALARYNPNGTLDPTFGSGGKVTTHFDFGGFQEIDRAFAVAIQPDGKIVTAGERVIAVEIDFSDIELVRYNPDGSLDTTFGDGGQVITHINFSGNLAVARGLVIQPDGRLVAAGYFANTLAKEAPFSDFALVRYNPDGSLDPTFGDGGHVLTDFSGNNDLATSVILQPDGKIVASGAASDSSSAPAFGIARYHTNGSLDPGFGAGGKTLSSLGGLNVASAASALQADGKLILAGPFFGFPFFPNIGFVIARFNSNGSLDPGFGAGGRVVTEFPGIGSYAAAVAIQADSKVVAAGTTFNADFQGDFALARYDGTSFDVCMQDDSNGNLLRFNSQTGDYQFFDCRKGLTLTGRGSVRLRFCKIDFSASRPDRSITALANPCTKAGSASVKLLPSGRVLTISDSDMTNNSCACR